MKLKILRVFIYSFAFSLFMSSILSNAQTTTQSTSKAKPILSSSTIPPSIASIIDNSFVLIENSNGKNLLGFCIENGYLADGITPKSSWIVTTSIDSKDNIYIKYRGVSIKAELKYNDPEADISILFVDNTVITKLSLDYASDNNIERNLSYYATSYNLNKISFIPVVFEKSLKLSSIDFIEISSKVNLEILSGGLFNANGIFLGIVSKKFHPSEKSSLVTSAKNVLQIKEAYFAAEIIKIISINEKFTNEFGGEFVKWLYKGSEQGDDKYLKMYNEAIKLFLSPNSEGYDKYQKSLFEIAMIYYNKRNSTVNSQNASNKNLYLICHLSNQKRDNNQPMTFKIDFLTETVNGYKASITDGYIIYSYVGGSNNTYSVKIDRIGGYANISTDQFPSLMTGPCSKSEGRAF